mmetsp:Transcript_75337/g.215700  ORF Transcript_75337/g.215700 Transcript_75337/m.215700 type:complete len:481 (+) Transcript_75337:88-1530(+)
MDMESSMSLGMTHDVETRVNTSAWTALAVFCMLGPMAYGAEMMWISWSDKPSTRSGMPFWSFVLLVCSYILLTPGLICTLFRYDVSALNGVMELQHGSESMIEFIKALSSTGCWYGAAVVTLYAMVIPGIKLVLLITAEVLRIRSPRSVRAARMCILIVQMISKWASPDMFAYVLLMYLVRELDHPPKLEAVGHLNLGFTSFALFCIFSTVACLGIQAPELPASETALAVASEPTPLRRKLRSVVPFVATFLFVAFAATLAIGASLPCMALHLDLDMLFEPTGHVPLSFKPFVETLGLVDLMHSEVNLWKCLGTLAKWGASGNANFFIAFVLFAVFAIGFTILDMLVLTVAAWQLRPSSRHSNEVEMQGRSADEHQGPCRALSFARVLKKLSMLDVAIVGIVVVTLCGYVYRKSGVIVSMRWGLSVLFVAELCHYAAYHLVTGLAPSAPPQPAACNEKANDAGVYVEDELSSESAGSTNA